MAREAGDVHLVNDCRGKTPMQRLVALPIVRAVVDDRAFHGDRVLLCVSGRPAAGIRLGHDDRAPIWVEQGLARIETQATLGIEGTKRAIGVELSGTDPRHENVPIVIGAVLARIEGDYTGRLRLRGIVEE